jgi:hypothetical protein
MAASGTDHRFAAPQRHIIVTSDAKSDGCFGKREFVYIAEEDVHKCPAGGDARPDEDAAKKQGLPASGTSTTSAMGDAHFRALSGNRP